MIVKINPTNRSGSATITARISPIQPNMAVNNSDTIAINDPIGVTVLKPPFFKYIYIKG